MQHKTLIRGFSLMEMSVVLTIMAVVIAGVLPGMTSMNKSRDTEITLDRISRIHDAILAYRLANDTLPCPTNLLNTEGTQWFGVAADVSNPALAGQCFTNVALAAPGSTATAVSNPSRVAATSNATNIANYASSSYATATGGVVGGVPVRTLGLPDEYAYDAWGRRFFYNVDKRITAAGSFTTYSPTDTAIGVYTVNDAAGSARTTKAVYVIVSAGQDGHGGITQGGAPFSRAITNAQTLANCNCNSSAVATAYTTTFVQRAKYANPASSLDAFDDIVDYKLRSQIEASSVLAAGFWAKNGTTNLYPSDGTTMGVAVGASTTAAAGTTPAMLVYETANDTAMHIASTNTGNSARGLYITNASTNTSNSNSAALTAVAANGITTHLAARNRYGVFTTANVASAEPIRAEADGLTDTAISAMVLGTNTSAASNNAIIGQVNRTSSTVDATGVRGVIGNTVASTGDLTGVMGLVTGGASGTNVMGVRGIVAGSVTGSARGVQGQISDGAGVGTGAAAVAGHFFGDSTGNAYGVIGSIEDEATISGVATGVRGRINGPAATSGVTRAIEGRNEKNSGAGTEAYGVYGIATGSAAYGVYGLANGTGATKGVYGQVSSATGRAIEGYAPAGGYGVYCGGSGAFLCGNTQGVAWTTASDERLKTDVRELSEKDGISSIMRLRPVTFHWKDAERDKARGEQFGFIAQDIEKIFPSFVINGGEGKFKDKEGKEQTVKDTRVMSYETLVVPLVKAVQEIYASLTGLIDEVKKLAGRVDTHEAEIKALKAENAALKKRLDAIERRLDAEPAKP